MNHNNLQSNSIQDYKSQRLREIQKLTRQIDKEIDLPLHLQRNRLSDVQRGLSHHKHSLQNLIALNNSYEYLPNNDTSVNRRLNSEQNLENIFLKKSFRNFEGVNGKTPLLLSPPQNLKKLAIKDLPYQDEINFHKIQNINQINLQKLSEILNNDNDIFYLQNSFPDLYPINIPHEDIFPENDSNNETQYLNQYNSTKKSKIKSVKHIFPNLNSTKQSQTSKSSQKSLINLFIDPDYPDKSNKTNFPSYLKKLETPKTTFQLKCLEKYQDKTNSSNIFSSNQAGSERLKPLKNMSLVVNNASYSLQNNNNYFIQNDTPKRRISVEQLYQSLENDVRNPKTIIMTLSIYTKSIVKIDVGIMGIQLKANKLIITKLYISKLYRKFHLTNLIKIKIIQFLFDNYRQIDNIEMKINSKCNDYIRFLFSIGFTYVQVDNDIDGTLLTILKLSNKNFELVKPEIIRKWSQSKNQTKNILNQIQ